MSASCLDVQLRTAGADDKGTRASGIVLGRSAEKTGIDFLRLRDTLATDRNFGTLRPAFPRPLRSAP
jgi:hypothetical protein